MAERLRGNVVTWFEAKAYGFIRPAGAGRDGDVFVFHRDVERDRGERADRALEIGDRVEFAIEASDDGRHKAVRVLRLEANQ